MHSSWPIYNHIEVATDGIGEMYLLLYRDRQTEPMLFPISGGMGVSSAIPINGVFFAVPLETYMLFIVWKSGYCEQL